MNRFFALFLVVITFSLSSCTIKETIVFNEDGAGKFLISYDMGGFMKQMKKTFEKDGSKNTKEKKSGKVMDTVMVFSEIMETYKDSVANLPEEKRLALEAVKDMYMKMTMNEDQGIFDFGIGLDFNSISDLKGICEKLEKAKSLNSKNDQVGAMKNGSPLGKFMVNEKNTVDYDMTETGFSRTTTVNLEENPEEISFGEEDKEFLDYFENSLYIIEYTFPKKIKSHSIDGGILSEDQKTITCKASWVDFIKSPKTLDLKVTFDNE
jgi:hypothetical protein